MQYRKRILRSFCLLSIAMLSISVTNALAEEMTRSGKPLETKTTATTISFPDGAATSSETCGVCHVAIYQEFVKGFGSDMKYYPMIDVSPKEKPLKLPTNVSSSASAHAVAGIDPFPIHARETEEEGRSCNVCHYPEPFNIPDIDIAELPIPKPRKKEFEKEGLTCASCHLTPDGKIRGPHDVQAPHETVKDTKMQTSAMCAYCHSMGKRVAGQQTQTFLEWREDFNKPGLGKQH